MPKAYSYLRFSTPEQARGDSQRRQASMAADYARRHGLELDDSLRYHDLGVSAFRGLNTATGRLGAFLEAVRTGLVARDSFLLVESLDRISRNVARRALRTLEDICEEGITVVTLADGQQYTAAALDQDPTKLIMSILIFIRANEESATKSRRNRSAWNALRTRAKEDGSPISAVCPAWLALDRDSNAFVKIPERVKVVRRIFRDTLRGSGQHALAESLNREGVAVFGRGRYWHRSYVSRILTNRAVLGVFTPHSLTFEAGRKVRTPLDEIANYYPAIIKPEDFQRVQFLLKRSRSPLRGRHAARGAIFNLFGGLMRCGRCNGTVLLVSKGAPPKGARYLACSAAKTGAGCKYQALRYDRIEAAFLENAERILAHVPTGREESDIERQLRNAEAGLLEIDAAVTNLLLAAEQGAHSPTLTARIEQRRAERDQMHASVQELRARMESESPQFVLNRCAELAQILDERPLPRARANAALRQLLASATLDFERGALVLEWRHGGESDVTIGWPTERR